MAAVVLTAYRAATISSCAACNHRYSAGKVAHILFSIGISADEEVAGLVQRMEGRGFPTRDLSDIEPAQVCTSDAAKLHLMVPNSRTMLLQYRLSELEHPQ